MTTMRSPRPWSYGLILLWVGCGQSEPEPDSCCALAVAICTHLSACDDPQWGSTRLYDECHPCGGGDADTLTGGDATQIRIAISDLEHRGCGGYFPNSVTAAYDSCRQDTGF